eukprot:4711057-Prymnesium_polylepis.1
MVSSHGLVRVARKIEEHGLVGVVCGVVRRCGDLGGMVRGVHVGDVDEELEPTTTSVVMPPAGWEPLHRLRAPYASGHLHDVPVVAHLIAQIATN